MAPSVYLRFLNRSVYGLPKADIFFHNLTLCSIEADMSIHLNVIKHFKFGEMVQIWFLL